MTQLSGKPIDELDDSARATVCIFVNAEVRRLYDLPSPPEELLTHWDALARQLTHWDALARQLTHWDALARQLGTSAKIRGEVETLQWPAPQPVSSPPSFEYGPQGLLKQCWREGVRATWRARIHELGRQTVEVEVGAGSDELAGLRAFAAIAAMGHGDYTLADTLLKLPLKRVSPAVLLLHSAAQLFRVCADSEREPNRVPETMAVLSSAMVALSLGPSAATPEGATARGYAHWALAEALLMVGDVGAARQLLENVLTEESGARIPAVLQAQVRCILAGIELAVGRTDLALGHLRVAVHEGVGLGPEVQMVMLLLIGVMLTESHSLGESLLRAATAVAAAPGGRGTIALLHRLLHLLAQDAPFSVEARAQVRETLRALQGRHSSAGWFLLLTGVCSGALLSAGDACEAYNILVHAAAMLRCLRMDGAADLCDRRVDALRESLGQECFEAVLIEVRKRREARMNDFYLK